MSIDVNDVERGEDLRLCTARLDKEEGGMVGWFPSAARLFTSRADATVPESLVARYDPEVRRLPKRPLPPIEKHVSDPTLQLGGLVRRTMWRKSSAPSSSSSAIQTASCNRQSLSGSPLILELTSSGPM